MRTIIFGVVSVLLCIFSGQSQAQQPTAASVKALFPTPSRTWTSQSGGSASGVVASINTKSDTVALRLADGRSGDSYSVSKFSETDQAYLHDASKGFLRGKVVGVHDGDSLTLLVAGNTQFKIRLESIDAPELGQEFGTSSKQGLSKMVFGKDVKVVISGKDKYQRFLGIVEVEGGNVNQKMIAQGLAWHFKEYSKDKSLAVAESSARNAETGLWSAFNPMAPWDYRDLKRAKPAKIATKEFEPFKTLTPTKPVVTSQPKPAPAASYWLNSSSSVRHNSGCRWFGNTKRGRYCTKSDGRACGICGG